MKTTVDYLQSWTYNNQWTFCYFLGHMVIGFKQVRVSSCNLVPSPSEKNHLLSLSGLAHRK